MKFHASILAACCALIGLNSFSFGETFPTFEDTAGSPVASTILSATGKSKTLAVSKKSSAFINFAVSGGAGNVIDPASVSGARLVIFLARASKTGTITISNLTSNFTETFTTKTIPTPTVGSALGTIPLSTFVPSLNADYFITDITAQVKAWLADPTSEFGVAITSDGIATATLASKEGAGSGHPAYIEIDVAGGKSASFSGPVTIANGGLSSPLTIPANTSGTVGRLQSWSNWNGPGVFNLNYEGVQTRPGLYFSESGVSSSNLVLREGGNVGVGTSNPLTRLQVGEFNTVGLDTFLTVATAGSNTSNPPADRLTGIKLRSFDNTFGFTIQNRDGIANSGLEILRHSASVAGTTAFFLGRDSGNIGIGTNTPTQATLVINSANGSVQLASAFGLLVPSGASGNQPAVNLQGNSIYTFGNIVGFQIIAHSDARIKNIQGISDGVTDLRTLQSIEVTDYHFKDTVQKGDRPQKKVIAQQVEKVYPQAVHRATDVVPDIYQKAELKDGWVQLATDLKVGDRVRLIAAREEGIHEVLEVREGAFRTAFQPATEFVFVYGREVNDYRQVDYDAIAMLNVSATQELARQLDAKEKELTALRAANTALAAQVSALEKRDAARESRLSRLERTLDDQPARTVSATFQ